MYSQAGSPPPGYAGQQGGQPQQQRSTMPGFPPSSSAQQQQSQQQQQQLQLAAMQQQQQAFFKMLSETCARRGVAFDPRQPPMVEGRPVDLWGLYNRVLQQGGYNAATQKGAWPAILSSLGYPAPHPEQRVVAVSSTYHHLLSPIESIYLSAQRERMAAAQAAQGQSPQGGQPGQGQAGQQGGQGQMTPQQAQQMAMQAQAARMQALQAQQAGGARPPGGPGPPQPPRGYSGAGSPPNQGGMQAPTPQSRAADAQAALQASLTQNLAGSQAQQQAGFLAQQAAMQQAQAAQRGQSFPPPGASGSQSGTPAPSSSQQQQQIQGQHQQGIFANLNPQQVAFLQAQQAQANARAAAQSSQGTPTPSNASQQQQQQAGQQGEMGRIQAMQREAMQQQQMREQQMREQQQSQARAMMLQQQQQGQMGTPTAQAQGKKDRKKGASLPPSSGSGQPPSQQPIDLLAVASAAPSTTEALIPQALPLQPGGGGQKMEYAPLTRTMDSFGSWDLGYMEELANQTASRRRARAATDLGLVDVASLTLSLRSRLPSEVAGALNTLLLLSAVVKQHPAEQGGIGFPLNSARGLVDELLDLLEETVTGRELDGWEDEEAEPEEPEDQVEQEQAKEGYRDLIRLVMQEEMELLPFGDEEPASKRRKHQQDDGALKPVDTLQSLLTILLNLSGGEDNARFLARQRGCVDLVLQAALLPLKRWSSSKEAGKGQRPRVTARESLGLRKDALEFLANLGLDIRLSSSSAVVTTPGGAAASAAEQPEGGQQKTAARMLSFLLFWLKDASHADQPYFDLSGLPTQLNKMPQPIVLPGTGRPYYLDLALGALARVAAPDGNRAMLGRAAAALAARERAAAAAAGAVGKKAGAMEKTWETLLHFLPTSPPDYALLSTEQGLMFTENAASSLHSLLHIAGPGLKAKMKDSPGVTGALWRVVRECARLGAAQQPGQDPLAVLGGRVGEILKLLAAPSVVGGGGGGAAKTGGGGAEQDGVQDVAWFGADMSNWTDDPVRLTHERGSVKARRPPGAGAGGKDDAGAAGRILVGEQRAVALALLGDAQGQAGGLKVYEAARGLVV